MKFIPLPLTARGVSFRAAGCSVSMIIWTPRIDPFSSNLVSLFLYFLSSNLSLLLHCYTQKWLPILLVHRMKDNIMAKMYIHTQTHVCEKSFIRNTLTTSSILNFLSYPILSHPKMLAMTPETDLKTH